MLDEMDGVRGIVTNQGPLVVKRCCGCGGIQIGLGAVSFKLARDAASFLQSALDKALSEDEAERREPPPMRLVPSLLRNEEQCH